MSIIICPNCKAILHNYDKILKCQNGHSFDVAKDGYINLLLANQKKKLNPGDNKIMMNAREAFLCSGYYDFLIDFIESSIKSLHVASDTRTENAYLLDLGCGTGYYTRSLLRNDNINKIGIDISKSGISRASKNDRNSIYIISSNYDLPIKDNSVEIVINIFSPISINEVKRVLKPGGYFLKVVPAKDHMKEIASLIYESFIPHQSSIETELSLISDLQIIKVEKLEKEILLSGENLYNLISMTPYLYKFESSELEKLKELLVTISFKIIISKYA